VTTLGNPATQLREILTRFAENAGNHASVADAWQATATAFADTPDRLRFRATMLVNEIEISTLALGDPDQTKAFEHWSKSWAKMLFSPDHAETARDSARGAVDRNSIVALTSIAAAFEAGDAASKTPQVATVDRQGEDFLRVLSAIRDAASVVTHADSLDPHLKRSVLLALARLEWTLQNAQFGGEDGLMRAIRVLAVFAESELRDVQDPGGMSVADAVRKPAKLAYDLLVALGTGFTLGSGIVQSLQIGIQ
jgi:hypothetical protein